MDEKPKIDMRIIHVEASGRDLIEGWTAGPIEDITFVPANLAKDLKKLWGRTQRAIDRYRTPIKQRRGSYLHSHKGRALRRHPIRT